MKEIEHEIASRQLRLVVTGPRTVQPGAPAEFEVRTVDHEGQPADVTLSARLEGDAQRKKAKAAKDHLSEDKAAESDLTISTESLGVYRVRIPPTVRLQPGQSLGMLVTARKKSGGAGEAVQLSGQVRLTAPVYLTHLTTDKPMYQPGEFVQFRSLTLDRLTLQPPAEDFSLNATLTSPTGAVRPILQGRTALVRQDAKEALHAVIGPDSKPVHGIGAGSWLLEPDAPGGEYTLTVNEQFGRFSPVNRKFIVNRFQKPRLDKKIDFNRSSYGPGDEVQVRASAKLAGGGGAVENANVEAAVKIDDKNYDASGSESPMPIRGKTDADGSLLLRFSLPKAIERGSASLAVTFTDGATETIVRPIPLVLAKLDVEFFPEGGDLVAGLSNRVYFQARTPLGKPAELRGVLLENGKPLPVPVATLSDNDHPGVNQGNGVFAFTPRDGANYALRIDTPAGVVEKKSLPMVRADRVVLRVEKGVFESDETIRVHVGSTKPRSLLVGAYCRGEVLATATLGRGQTEATLTPTSGAGGVCRVTVFEEIVTGQTQRLLQPVAERLVYRVPRGRIDVSISPDQRRYLPGQKVNLSLVTTDEKEKPTPAIVMLAVVDRSVVNLADMKTDRSMPTHFLLGSEVRRADDLEYADFLLGPQAKAPQALDLLLGTQGWRRFAEQNPDQFRQRFLREAESLPENDRLRQQEEGERLLVMIGQSEPQRTDFDQDRIDEAAEAHAGAVRVVEKVGDEKDYKSAVVDLTRYDRWFQDARRVALPTLIGLMALMAVVALLRRTEVRWAYLATTFGLLLFVVALSPNRSNVPTVARGPSAVAKLHISEAEFGMLKKQLGDLRDKAKDAAKADRARPVAPGAMMGVVGGAGGPPMPRAGMAPLAPTTVTKLDADGFGGGVATRPLGRRAGDGNALFEADKKKTEFRDVNRNGEKAANLQNQNDGLALIKRAEQMQYLAPEAQLRQLEARNFGLAKGAGKEAKDRGAMFDLPLVFREFAHVRKETPGVRDDFAETVYWHPVLVLNHGKANVSFDLCDSVTTFEATAYAHTLDGRLGSAVKRIESRLPFSLAPKVPVEVTAGDRIDLPVAVSNTTAEQLGVQLKLTGHEGLDVVSSKTEESLSLAPESRGRRVFSFRPRINEGVARVEFQGKAGAFTDAIREGFRVVPDGFPTQGASSDLLDKSTASNA